VGAIFPPEHETRLVREFFASRGSGFFVEVGANDPKVESQSWHLEEAGWAGILVEPQPELAIELQASRRARVFAVACSSPQHNGSVMPLQVAGPFSSLNANLMATGIRAETSIDVLVRTLDGILTEINAPQPIDFMSIDVEGHELDVLQGLDLAHWRPRLILLEDHVTSLAKHNFLRAAGYRLMRRTGLNGWYVPYETEFQLDIWGRWQIIRKYYLALPLRILRESKRRLRDRIKFGLHDWLRS
jgi:FkbM family methyltransferase